MAVMCWWYYSWDALLLVVLVVRRLLWRVCLLVWSAKHTPLPLM